MELSPAPNYATARCRTLAITSGKGGVGKSSITVNLGLSLAKQGLRVCLFDADTGLANANILLDLHPQFTIEHVLSGEKALADIMLTAAYGMKVIPAATGIVECAELAPDQQQRLLNQLRAIDNEFDYLLIDTAAGIGSNVLHFVASAQQTLVVITPEPTSLTDAFSLIRVLKRLNYHQPLQVVVNMCSDAQQARDVFNRLRGVVKKYVGLDLKYLGFLHFDESMRRAVQLQLPVALYPGNDPSSRSFLRLAEHLETLWQNAGSNGEFASYWQQLSRTPPQNSLNLLGPAEFVQRVHQLVNEGVWSTRDVSQVIAQLQSMPQLTDIEASAEDDNGTVDNITTPRKSRRLPVSAPLSVNVDGTSDSMISESGEGKHKSPRHTQPVEEKETAATAPFFDLDWLSFDHTLGDQQQLLKALQNKSPQQPLDAFLREQLRERAAMAKAE